MNSLFITNFFRFVVVVLLQVLIFKRIPLLFENLSYVNILIYPLFILLLPMRTPHWLVVFLAFLTGISVDFFYDSLGVHASAALWLALLRPYVISKLEPRGGYNVADIPTKRKFGFNWFFIYCSVLLFIHIFFYFSAEIFTFVYIGEIFLRTVVSFFTSMIFIMIYIFSINPRE